MTQPYDPMLIPQNQCPTDRCISAFRTLESVQTHPRSSQGGPGPIWRNVLGGGNAVGPASAAATNVTMAFCASLPLPSEAACAASSR